MRSSLRIAQRNHGSRLPRLERNTTGERHGCCLCKVRRSSSRWRPILRCLWDARVSGSFQQRLYAGQYSQPTGRGATTTSPAAGTPPMPGYTQVNSGVPPVAGYVAPAGYAARRRAPVRSGGGSAVKIILIVLVAIIGLGMLGAAQWDSWSGASHMPSTRMPKTAISRSTRPTADRCRLRCDQFHGRRTGD